MHQIITHEISRLQVEDMLSHARLARLARRPASGDAVPSHERWPRLRRARLLRPTA